MTRAVIMLAEESNLILQLFLSVDGYPSTIKNFIPKNNCITDGPFIRWCPNEQFVFNALVSHATLIASDSVDWADYRYLIDFEAESITVALHGEVIFSGSIQEFVKSDILDLTESDFYKEN